MKRYCIKSREGKIEFFDIVSENDDGYKIRLTRLNGGDERVTEESMTRNLFDMCVKAGYIFELEEDAATVA